MTKDLLKKGDFIKCADADDVLQTAFNLAAENVATDFEYKDGELIGLRVIGTVHKKRQTKDTVLQIRVDRVTKGLFQVACGAAGKSQSEVLIEAIKSFTANYIEEE